tara:strand:- start:1047 stop:1211 length:165 start_codon:yes stop_codon:yes gene_type:complete
MVEKEINLLKYDVKALKERWLRYEHKMDIMESAQRSNRLKFVILGILFFISIIF